MRPLRLGLVLLALCTLPSARNAVCAADEGATVPTGDVRLASGLGAQFDYHFDRNALVASERIEDALIALTRSGNLVRFDLEAKKPTREWFGPCAVTCLGRGDHVLLAGMEDGRVCKLDPANLALTEIAKLPGKPRWVGLRPTDRPGTGRDVVAAIERKGTVEMNEGSYDGEVCVVYDIASGKEYPFKRPASTFHLDRKSRLWVGGDMGEFGGWCSVVDFAAGTARAIAGRKIYEHTDELLWDGVYGFVELKDGQVWAYGGMSHMGSNGSYVWRVDSPKVEELARFNNDEQPDEEQDHKAAPRVDRPRMPITHVLEGPDEELIVYSFSDVYRTNRKLEKWTKLGTLRIRYRWGRPDAMGSYPSVVRVHGLDVRKGTLLCATARDGYVVMAGGQQSARGLPNQLGARRVGRIENTTEGTLYIEPYSDDPPWTREAGAWKLAALVPKIQQANEAPVEQQYSARWDQTSILVGTRGSLYVVSGSSATRWLGGKATVLCSGSDTHAFCALVTPDGELWETDSTHLSRLIDGKYTAVAVLPGADPKGLRTEQVGENAFAIRGQGTPIGMGLHVVGDAGPPWTLMDSDESQLLQLSYDTGAREPKLTVVSIIERAKPLPIYDAIPWAKDQFLLATQNGLRLYDTATSKLSPAGLPEPGRAVRQLQRDGLARLWLGGDGLRMIDLGSKTLHPFDALPMMGRTAVVALAADLLQKDGVIVSLAERGVVFVRAPKTP